MPSILSNSFLSRRILRIKEDVRWRVGRYISTRVYSKRLCSCSLRLCFDCEKQQSWQWWSCARHHPTTIIQYQCFSQPTPWHLDSSQSCRPALLLLPNNPPRSAASDIHPAPPPSPSLARLRRSAERPSAYPPSDFQPYLPCSEKSWRQDSMCRVPTQWHTDWHRRRGSWSETYWVRRAGDGY
jgi:hypothetical protein